LLAQLILVQLDESVAHKRIQDTFSSFSRTIVAYGGAAREIRGDALLAEFDRASDAVNSALAFQTMNRGLNAALEGEIKPQLRIGISLGEVVIADNTITGAGVVLAQRLEQLAEPDGVIVQGSVADTVPTRLPFVFESLGEQMLKGFDQPVRAFVARLEAGKELPAPEVSTTSKSHPGGHNAPSGFTGSGPTNLPNQLASLVGRPRDLGSVRNALTASSLVTLTGREGAARLDLQGKPARKHSNSLSTESGMSSWGRSPILIWLPMRSPVCSGCVRNLVGRWSRRWQNSCNN
jgi:hypothetical protein